jgi:membrane protease YdiL (CAAX protease family)
MSVDRLASAGLPETSWIKLAGFAVGLVALELAGVYLGVALVAWSGLDASADVGFLLGTLGVPSLLGIVWVWLFVRMQGRSLRAFGLRPLSTHWLQVALLAAPTCFIVGALIAAAFAPLLGSPTLPAPIAPEDGHGGVGFILSFILCGVVLAPLLEELVFRGVVYAGLRRRMGVVASAAIAALLHAAVHFDLASMLPLTAIFFLFGLLYERSGSLWASVIAHGGHNLISMGLALIAAAQLR